MRVNSDTESTELSESDVWATPNDLFAVASALYGPFDLDAAAMAWNAKAPVWLGPGSRYGESALTRSWAGASRAWCNPPYSKPNLDLFTSKGRQEVLAGIKLVCFCVPANTTSGWFHKYILAPEGRVLGASHGDSVLGPRDQVQFERLTVERLTIRGRVHFVEASGFTGSARGHHVLATLARPGVLPRLQRRRGAPQKVTPELDARVRELVDGGTPLQDALDQAGVNRRTWYRHLERRRGAA